MLSPCPLCGNGTAAQLLAQGARLRPPIARLIAAHYPGWQPADGLCPTCALTFMQRLQHERAAVALHTSTEPHATFPYYHPAEETVLSQAERLPDYATYQGRGVTVAFLDSGYYPHPDLTGTTAWPEPAPPWATLTPDQLRTLLEAQPLRFANYIDLTDGGERVGLTQPSLWDGAGDSWHGQMTTSLVAGNGSLSGGRYRGYAAGATLLPIKIGRGGGRIPEEDILAGLQWLLRDRHWERYQVRVVNMSVGGDFLQDWRANAVCQAAEALAERGVFLAAAAGNSNKAELRAPAQSPSVLTVGGVDDGNRPWQSPGQSQPLALYPHNYGSVTIGSAKGSRQSLHKPELLALGFWLPAPILPVSPIFGEVAALGALRRVLLGYDELRVDDFAALADGLVDTIDHHYRPPTWMPKVWQAVRERMNAHKWIHPYYQHVDGTSVAVAQVSAVAAQMVEANPRLDGAQLKAILLESALPLPDLPAARTGAGLLQPRRAVALALRRGGGSLTPYPCSSTLLSESELQKWVGAGRVPLLGGDQPATADSRRQRAVYLGIYAPTAQRVSLTGTFNQWQPTHHMLAPTPQGWWHGVLRLPPGHYLYRFWVEGQAAVLGQWLPDYENSTSAESGYRDGHSVILVE